jgi:hypothetical protein
MSSELVALEKSSLCEDDPRFAVCYARGSVFKKEGALYRVEKGSRNVVHRALCLAHHYGPRCKICPNGSIVIELRVTHPER